MFNSIQNCFSALDGTLIKVTPPNNQKSRYQTRKANIAPKVLGVCFPNMRFIYVLPSQKGSAHNGRVLRNAISKPNGLRVPQGKCIIGISSILVQLSSRKISLISM